MKDLLLEYHPTTSKERHELANLIMAVDVMDEEVLEEREKIRARILKLLGMTEEQYNNRCLIDNYFE